MHVKKILIGLSLLALISSTQAQTLSELKAEVDLLKQQNEAILAQIMQPDNRTQIGGYGELHYNHLVDKANLESAESRKRIDFHRFVLFFGHTFSDNLSFFSELELEHSLAGDGDDKPGEVELEQAYLDFRINDNNSLKAGVFLVPVGLLNETHEPNTFYGVERNNVEKNIIPSTWWEGGLLLSHQLRPGLSLDLGLHSGLSVDTSENGAYKIRSGRQKVANATASDLATTARLKWTGKPGLEVAATLQHQADITQSSDPTAGDALLAQTHVRYQQGPIGLRALYARWDLAGDGPKAIGADTQKGYFLEPSYRINQQFGLFARFSQWDNAAGNDTDSEYAQTDLGLNYWPHENTVVKVDYQNQSTPTNTKELDGFNIGIGYQF